MNPLGTAGRSLGHPPFIKLGTLRASVSRQEALSRPGTTVGPFNEGS
jgi:hypothetical protein